VRRTTTIAIVSLLLTLIVWQMARSLPGPELRDYGSFIASGRAANEGQNPYSIHPLTFHVSLRGFEVWNPNLNPPLSVLVFQVFDRIEPFKGLRLWWSFSLICYVASIGLLAWQYGQSLPLVLWGLALAGFWDTLFLGQIYVPLVMAAIGCWIMLERGRDIAAGLLLGLVIAVKPNFLVWPGLLLLAGYRRVVVVAGATALLLSALPLMVHGPEIYRQWFELIFSDRHRTVFLTNTSLLGLTERVGTPLLGRVLSLLLLFGLALWAWRRRPAAPTASAMGILGGILASPIAWIHYTLFLLPLFFARSLTFPMRLAAMLLVLPVPFILRYLGADGWVQVSIGSAYAWGVLLCFFAEARRAGLTP
jgi:hypothetical protein